MDKINEFLKANYKVIEIAPGINYAEPVKRIECADGFTMSVQANDYSYCEPRETNAFPYFAVEVGFPSEVEDYLKEYAEDECYTETIYPYTPIVVVNQVIEKHGGIIN